MRLLEYLDDKVKRYHDGGGPVFPVGKVPGWLNRINLLNTNKRPINENTKLINENTKLMNENMKRRMSENRVGLLNKLNEVTNKKVRIDDNMDVDVSAEELLNNVKNFYLQHPTYEELGLFQKIFDAIGRDPYGFFKLFKIKSVLPISSVNGIIIVIETRSKKNIIDNQLLVKIPQNLQYTDSVTYEWYIGQVVNSLRVNKWSDNFALVYGLINCNFNSDITYYMTNIAKLKKQYGDTETWSDRLTIKTKLEIEKAKLDLHIMSKNHLCEGDSPKPHIIYEYLRNIKTNKTETLEAYIKRLSNPDLNLEQKKNIELNIVKIMIMLMYSLQVAQDHLDFVHYDLHLGNVLVIELERPETVSITYEDKKFTFMSNAIPYIIDYGRSYVNPKTAGEIIGSSAYSDTQLSSRIFKSFKSYQSALFKNQYFPGKLTDKNILEFNEKIFNKITLLLMREGVGSELYYYGDTNMFYIVKEDDATRRYIIIDNKKYIVKTNIEDLEKVEYIVMAGKRKYIEKYDISTKTDKNDMIEWLSTNIYNKDIPANVSQLTKEIKGDVLLNHYDLGIHSNRVNKKYDMFRICKLVCKELKSMELVGKGIWSVLDKQLSVEYPFSIDLYNVLPSDYHITDFFNIQRSNTNKVTKKWLKTPRDIADFLESSISSGSISPTAMQVDAEHSFQIAK